MRIELIAFTEVGLKLGARLADGCLTAGDEARLASGRKGGVSARAWAEMGFHFADALVFIGAAGIAVRSVAPFLKSKATDPAVIVIDDMGRFAISLLSGHIGGANALTERLAGMLGARAVITTATDGRGVFAADRWAVEQGMAVANPERIKAVSAALLDGKSVALRSDFPIAGTVPAGVRLSGEDRPDIRVSVRAHHGRDALLLVPRAVTLGVGCRKGTPLEVIEDLFETLLRAYELSPLCVARVCSIDLKRGEPGLLAFCEKRGLPFVTYSADELRAVQGEFTASAFVAEITGVDNVCERGAALGGGGLIVRKTAKNGATMALALAEPHLSFETEART